MTRLLYLIILITPYCHAKTTPISIISLGSACNVAGALRDNNLRTLAYPFDWIISPFNALYNALSDDFEHFLSAESLMIRMPDQYGVLDHYGFHFVHDFPVDRPNDSFADLIGENHITGGIISPNWKDSLPAVKEKYLKRIFRFNNICHQNENIYFIRYGDTTKQQAILLRDLLKEKYPTLNFILMVLDYSNDMKQEWHLDQIQNIYISEKNHPDEWTNIFKLVGFLNT